MLPFHQERGTETAGLALVQEIKKQAVALAIDGSASRLRGVIVTPEIYQTFKKETKRGFDGGFSVLGIEGNRSIAYTFYVLENPNFPKSAASNFFFTHHKEIDYRQKYLGREEDVLRQDKRQAFIDGFTNISELNPLDGVVSIGGFSFTRYYYNVDYDEVVAVAQRAKDEKRSVISACDIKFERHNLVHNPPQTRWLGHLAFNFDHLAFNKDSVLTYADVDNCLPFCDSVQEFRQREQVGRLYMKRPSANAKSYAIVGLAINGFYQIEEITLPESETDNWQDFAKIAIKYFLPEEIFLALNMSKAEDLHFLKALPVQEYWGDRSDRERAGRTHEFSISSGRREDGHVLSADFIDTRANECSVEIAYVPNSDISFWNEIHSRNFPPVWQGWPETARDRQIAAFAQNL